MSFLYFRYSEKSESLAQIRHAKYLDIARKTKMKVNPATLPQSPRTAFFPATLPQSPRTAFFQSLRVYLQMKTWKNLDEIETEITKWGWKVNNGMCYPVMTNMLPRRESFLKLIRCNCETGTDAACGKRCSCRKNGLFCAMVCGQCHGEECSNKSKSSIIHDIDEDNDCNVFDAIASFL